MKGDILIEMLVIRTGIFLNTHSKLISLSLGF
jgi:hypothetical protein